MERECSRLAAQENRGGKHRAEYRATLEERRDLQEMRRFRLMLKSAWM